MPPCAALECERTGWTFETIPTDTPCSAAASAARCPASPAPITSTSCLGISTRDPIGWSATHAGWRGGPRPGLQPGWTPSGRALGGWAVGRDLDAGRVILRGADAARDGAPQGSSDLVGGDDTAEMALLVHGHQSSESPEGVVAQQRLERGVGADP